MMYPDLRPDISTVCKALKDIKAEADQKATFPAVNNIDLLDALHEKELQIQTLNGKLDKLDEKELQIQFLIDTLQEKESQIQSLNKRLSDAECILKQNENDMKRKDQELQQLIEQQLDTPVSCNQLTVYTYPY